MGRNLFTSSAESDERANNMNDDGWACTHKSFGYKILNIHADLKSHVPKSRPNPLMKTFDAKKQWVAWSSGLAPGLLPMWFWFEPEHKWPWCGSGYRWTECWSWMKSSHPRDLGKGMFCHILAGEITLRVHVVPTTPRMNRRRVSS